MGGCVVLVNSTYNLSYLSPFCSSYLPSPAFPPQTPTSSFFYSLTHVVLFFLTFSFHSHPKSHSHALAYFTFFCRLFSSSFLALLLLLFGVNGFTYLQVFFSWSCKRSLPLKKHNISFSIFLSLRIHLVLTLTYSLSHTFFLSFSPAKLLKHRQVKYCITIVLVWSKSNIFNPFGDTWHFER